MTSLSIRHMRHTLVEREVNAGINDSKFSVYDALKENGVNMRDFFSEHCGLSAMELERRAQSRLDAILAEFEEYDEWSDALAEQETLLTADEYYSTLDEQDYEAELHYARTASQPL